MSHCKSIFLRLVVIFNFISALNGIADIKQVKTMEEALAPVDAETLLILDLDNTIMETTQTLGSDQWFEHHVHKIISDLVKAGQTEEEAKKQGLKIALSEWKQIQRVTSMQLVEPVTAKLIQQKQERIKVIGLTARPVDLAPTTRNQLQSMGVDLSRSPVVAQDIVIQNAGEVDYIAKFEKGILFSGNNKKGEMLVKFFQLARLSPKKIIFVDDKQRNVDSVEKSLNELGGVSHTSMRYGAADDKVASFDSKIAGVQFFYFGKVLTDKAASAILRD